MRAIWHLVGMVGPAALAVSLLILALLSQRLGSVIRMPPIYRFYFPASLLLMVAAFSRLVRAGASPADQESAWLYGVWFEVAGYILPMTLGLTIGVIVTWMYWSWLLRERGE